MFQYKAAEYGDGRQHSNGANSGVSCIGIYKHALEQRNIHMEKDYIELKIKKHTAEKIYSVFRLLILVFIPYSILSLTFGWWGELTYYHIFTEIGMALFISLGSIVYIRLLDSYQIIWKVYLLIPLFLTFLSSPITIILQFAILTEPQFHDVLLELCMVSAFDFIVSGICSVFYVHYLKTKRKKERD